MRESDCRRPAFADGVPIVLADGQPWTFPRPLLGLFPERGDDGALRFGEKARFNFGRDYDGLVDELLAADDGKAEATALLQLAADLLSRNYAVPADGLCSLLPRLIGCDRNAEMWREIADVALGRGPKPTPVG